jgi:hypothetical protein
MVGLAAGLGVHRCVGRRVCHLVEAVEVRPVTRPVCVLPRIVDVADRCVARDSS